MPFEAVYYYKKIIIGVIIVIVGGTSVGIGFIFVMLNSIENENPIIDYLDFEQNLEKALASVFGDELMASINKDHKMFWKKLNNQKEVEFPSEVTAFSKLVKTKANPWTKGKIQNPKGQQWVKDMLRLKKAGLIK